jgi:hypothetical protein
MPVVPETVVVAERVAASSVAAGVEDGWGGVPVSCAKTVVERVRATAPKTPTPTSLFM